MLDNANNMRTYHGDAASVAFLVIITDHQQAPHKKAKSLRSFTVPLHGRERK